MKIEFTFILVLLYWQISFSQIDTIQAILNLQDNRNESYEKLVPFLSSTNAKVREQTLLAFANRQDSASVKYAVKFLDDGSPNVRRMAAFSLGQLQDSNATPALFNRLRIEKNPPCSEELFNAIGLTGTKTDLQKVIEQRLIISTEYETNIALCISRFANRKIRDSAATEYLISILSDKKSTERAIYALMRINDASSAKRHQSLFVKYRRHQSANIRMWSATILGNIKDSCVTKYLIDLAHSDKDYRVRVNAIRALKNHYSQSVVEDIVLLIQDENEHVSLTAINLIEQFIQSKLLSPVHAGLTKVFKDRRKFSSRQRGEIAKALAASNDTQYVSLLEDEFPKADDLLRGKIVEAIGAFKSSVTSLIVKNALKEKNSTIQIAAISAYQGTVATLDDSRKLQFFNDIITLLSRKNAGISYAIAIAFQDTLFSISIKKKYLPQIISAFSAMNSEDDIEPMLEFIKVFGLLKDSSTISTLQHSLNDENTLVRTESKKMLQSIVGTDVKIQGGDEVHQTIKQNLDDIQNYSGAVITTSKGDISILFCTSAAPFTINSFIGLVKKKFYDNLLFHRVVSNFVIQGGDPLGNGSGGPGYSIRTEVHPDCRYTEGAVGIASAGKDTEGSQFFITHCPTPHLDGRYTFFAFTKELSIVDKIMVGDTIRSISLIPMKK
jgi:cyclophilin family peptidyl-prolyl cis-trans isomerase/HEAT repeat protein